MTLHSRLERINEEIRVGLSEVLAQSKDIRFQDRMITVSGVKTAPDLSFAKVWISVYGSEQDKKEVFSALEHAKGFLRTRLAHTVILRVVPQLSFVEDTSFEYADKINSLLKKALPSDVSTTDVGDTDAAEDNDEQ